jgi:hypothetical protein
MKILPRVFMMSALAVASVGCTGLFHMNLATKRDPPPMFDYTGDEIIANARHGELYYWFAEPTYGAPVASRTDADVHELGTTSSMYSDNEAVIFMQKNDSDLLQTDCFWKAKGVVRKANANGDFSNHVYIVGSSSDTYTMDCALFDKAKAALDAKQPQPAE